MSDSIDLDFRDDPEPDDRDHASADRGGNGGTEFSALGLLPELTSQLERLGYEEPTPIQAAAIPVLIERRDVVGQAATGTGKTAAFALPILQQLAALPNSERARPRTPSALVLVPTRELAMQVSEAIHNYGRAMNARVVPVFGGQPIGRQLQVLARGVDVVVATPGRAVDHVQRRSLVLDSVATVVLDEADEMLDMGFAEDLESILNETPADRQTVLFSATMPPRLKSIATAHLNNATHIEIQRPAADSADAGRVRQVTYMVRRAHKPAALGRVLDVEAPDAAIVFCRTRTEVDQLTEQLNGRGYRAEALHGGMSQEQRDRVMARVRNGTAELLIATDVAARGLDIDGLTHVVNYDVPSAPEAYVHRIGRVGRAGRTGVAITLAEPREDRLLKNIERITRRKMSVEQLPTVDDLRSRRMELTLSSLREVVADAGHDRYRVIVEALSTDHDLIDIAMAAVRMAHESTHPGQDHDEEIPDVGLGSPGGKRGGQGRGSDERERGSGRERSRGASRDDYYEGPPTRGQFDRDRGRDSGSGRHRSTGEEMTSLYINLGRGAGIRPGDLVGAIANETSLTGRQIGGIQITDRFSIIEVPASAANEVIAAIKSTTIKGKRAMARRDRRPS